MRSTDAVRKPEILSISTPFTLSPYCCTFGRVIIHGHGDVNEKGRGIVACCSVAVAATAAVAVPVVLRTCGKHSMDAAGGSLSMLAATTTLSAVEQACACSERSPGRVLGVRCSAGWAKSLRHNAWQLACTSAHPRQGPFRPARLCAATSYSWCR